MIVQWCCRGMRNLTVAEVEHILGDQVGLTCPYWPSRGPLRYDIALSRLTENHLDLHVNHYDAIDPDTAMPVSKITPFISLSAGCVTVTGCYARTNASGVDAWRLDFATDGGRHPGWIFTCWVFVGINRAPGIEAVAEEVRELNHARRYSAYFVEGEVAAKINVASRQILCAEYSASGRALARSRRSLRQQRLRAPSGGAQRTTDALMLAPALWDALILDPEVLERRGSFFSMYVESLAQVLDPDVDDLIRQAELGVSAATATVKLTVSHP